MTDALGSTVALTDALATVQTQYTYDPFGGAAMTGSSSGNPFQYTGRENDGTTLQYYRARYYHPGLHRFVSEDPAGSTNPYTYVDNNPLMFVDPLGLMTLQQGACLFAAATILEGAGILFEVGALIVLEGGVPVLLTNPVFGAGVILVGATTIGIGVGTLALGAYVGSQCFQPDKPDGPKGPPGPCLGGRKC